jgi:hypothetical protein
MPGVARFDCYPSDLLNGMIGMTADQIAVYTVVLLLQYDRGEAVLFEGRERELAIRSGMSRGRLEKAVADLVSLGKLNKDAGSLWNTRAKAELAKISERISKNAENSAKGGNATRQKFDAIRNEIKEPSRPNGQPIGQPSLGPNSPPPPPPIEDNLISLSERGSDAGARPIEKGRKKNDYPPDFLVFWDAYPTDANMSKKDAAKTWARMSPDSRAAAMESLAGFNAYCRSNPDYRPVHACRYLSQERFEGHLASAKKIAAQVFVRKGSAASKEWERHNGKPLPSMFSKEHGGDGWFMPSEYPPRTEHAA